MAGEFQLGELYTTLTVRDGGFRVAMQSAQGQAEGAHEKMLRLNTAGRSLTYLLASELPAGAGRAIGVFSSLGTAAAQLTGKMQILALVSRGAMYAVAAAGGYALGKFAAGKIYEMQTGVDWEKDNAEALDASAKKQADLLEDARRRQRAIDAEAVESYRNVETIKLKLKMESLAADDKERLYIQETILNKERQNALMQTGNMLKREAINLEYDARIEAARMAQAAQESNAAISAMLKLWGEQDRFKQSVEDLLKQGDKAAAERIAEVGRGIMEERALAHQEKMQRLQRERSDLAATAPRFQSFSAESLAMEIQRALIETPAQQALLEKQVAIDAEIARYTRETAEATKWMKDNSGLDY